MIVKGILSVVVAASVIRERGRFNQRRRYKLFCKLIQKAHKDTAAIHNKY